MAADRTEYQEEYCGMGGSKRSKAGPPTIMPCKKSEDEQPVGGRCANKYRIAMEKAAAERAAATASGAGTAQADATRRFPMPAFDVDFVAEVNNRENRGTHNAQREWSDPRLSQPVRATNSTLMESADRDPCHRKTFEMYKSTAVDPMRTPCTPLAVPDVHKLRYMHNNYMTADDWY